MHFSIGRSANTPSTKELLTKGEEKKVPALPTLPPKEDGNFFAGWVNKATGEEVKKGDLLTESIEIAPVWLDCGEGNHTDADENNRCDDCGYILQKPSEPENPTDPSSEPTTGDQQKDDDTTQDDDDGVPIWAIILVCGFGLAIGACGAVLTVVLKKKK